jgi:hypothetical protein
MDWFNLAKIALVVAPTIVQSVETLFSHKPKSGPAKAEAALAMAQQGLVAALGIDPSAFGDAEKALVSGINNAVVAYYNAKGCPTPA